MKSFILSIAITLLHIGSIYSQSQLELEVVKQLNIYRKNHKLGSVKYDLVLSNVAAYHSKYIIECGKIGHVVNSDKMPHDEQFDLKNFKELNFEQRASMAPDKHLWGEIMIAAALYSKDASIESIAKDIIESFNGSPKHKEIMLAPDPGEGIKCIIGLSIIKVNYTDHLNEYTINIDFGDLVKE